MRLTELPFPLWLVIHRGECPWRAVTLTPGLATAFSNHARAGEFLRAANNPAWEVRPVIRVTQAVVWDAFQRQGVTGVALDPDADGGGTSILFDDMKA